MAVTGVATVKTFGVWDVTNGTWKTGDAANLTLRLTADGTESTPSGTAVEVDATNAPGQYKLALTAAENTGIAMTLGGVSSTPGCIVVPACWDNLDASILSRGTSTLTAQQVWEYGTRTVSTYGTLVADVAAAVWGAVARTITGGTLTTAPLDATATQAAAAAALAAYDAATGAEVTAVGDAVANLPAPPDAAIWTEALATQIETNLDVAVSSVSGAGTGTETVTVTVVDDSGDVRPNEIVTVVNQNDDSAVLSLTTDENGVAIFYINNTFEMTATVPTRVGHSGGETDFTVSGATPVTVTVTAVAIPQPPAVGMCRLYAWMRYVEGGGNVGTGLGSIDIIDVIARASGEDDVLWSADEDAAVTDSSGYAYVDVPQGFQLRVQVAVPGWKRSSTIVIPSTTTLNLGTVVAFQKVAVAVA